jgi:hypothetical protein
MAQIFVEKRDYHVISIAKHLVTDWKQGTILPSSSLAVSAFLFSVLAPSIHLSASVDTDLQPYS